MSASKIIQAIEKLLLLHKSLLEKAKQKTELIKTGNIEALRLLTKDETKHIQAIRKFESERVNATHEFLQQKNQFIEQPSITDCIRIAEGSDKQKLLNLKIELEQQIKLLKQQNDLNQQLLEQSLQFVNLSLDLLLPDMDSFNYERSGRNQEFEQQGRSIFDSKA